MRAWAPLIFSAVLSGCGASMFSAPRTSWPPFPDGHFMHVGGFLQVSGTGRAEGADSDTARRSLARDAALVDAWERLRLYLGGLRLPGGEPAAGRAASSPEFSETLERLARSASVVETRFLSDDEAVVLLRLEKSRVNAAFQTRYP